MTGGNPSIGGTKTHLRGTIGKKLAEEIRAYASERGQTLNDAQCELLLLGLRFAREYRVELERQRGR